MAKGKQKLILSDKECALIKGLLAHTELNDQMIVSILSHLSRTINHREIGYFRDAANPKYHKYPTATKADVEQLLWQYGKFERLAKEIGIVPREAHFQLVSSSRGNKNCDQYF